MRPPYPLGTLCYVVRADDLRYIGHVVTVTGHGPRRDRTGCSFPCACRAQRTVAQILLHDGRQGCCSYWSSLVPICPPPTVLIGEDRTPALLPLHPAPRATEMCALLAVRHTRSVAAKNFLLASFLSKLVFVLHSRLSGCAAGGEGETKFGECSAIDRKSVV